MKFDAIVGNPPYQENISGNNENSSLSKQLFPFFIMAAISLNSKYVSLITPSRYFTGDAQDKSFLKLREYMKEHNHFSKIFHYNDEKDVFKDVTISGGISYFLYDSNYNGNVFFTERSSNRDNSIERPLFEKGLDVIISMNAMITILNKVRLATDFLSMTQKTFGRNAFGIVGKKSIIESITKGKSFEGAVKVFCAYEEIRYIDKTKIIKNTHMINKYKVFTSKGNGGAGIINMEKPVAILGKAYIGEPNTVCTDSLIPIGPFDTEIEVINLKKYMTGKFFRFMIGILKTSQNISQTVYEFVPMQDFTSNSDIDWSKSIPEIDKQFYAKYNLSEDEIAFIEEKIKPMEW